MLDDLYTERGLNAAVELAQDLGEELSDDVARAVCSAWHDGQSSAFYSFASSGHFDAEQRADLLRELSGIIDRGYLAASAADRRALDMLGTYLINRSPDEES